MNYQEALTKIHDGDIISIYPNKKSSLLSKIISKWSADDGVPAPYHTGIAVWIDAELHVLQMDPAGHNIVELSYYSNKTFHVLKKPPYVDIDKRQLIAAVYGISYTYFGAIVSGLSQYIPCIPYFKERKKAFCSQYCAEIWNHGGYQHTIPEKFDPEMLEEYLIARNIEVLTVETK